MANNYYNWSGLPGNNYTAGDIRFEFRAIGLAFDTLVTNGPPISGSQIASTPIPAVNITGQLTNAQIADLAAAKLTGQITAAQIADGSVSGTKFASGIEPVAIVSSVPGSLVTGTIYNTSDNSIYRWDDTAYVKTVPATDVTGQLVASQIAANAITAGKIAAGAVSTTELAAGAVTAAKIAAATITATELAAGSVTTAKIAANAVTANEIAANTITGSRIAANTITASNIAANTITASQIAAGTITATQIASGTITGTQISAGSINGDRITAGTLAADRIVASSISATQLSATAFSADNVITRAITLRDSSGTVILSPSTLLAPAYAETGLRNSSVTLSGSSGTIQINNAGGGSVTGIIMPGSQITSGNRSTYLGASVISANEVAADAITTQKLQVGSAMASTEGSVNGSTVTVTSGQISNVNIDPSLSVSLSGAKSLSGRPNLVCVGTAGLFFLTKSTGSWPGTRRVQVSLAPALQAWNGSSWVTVSSSIFSTYLSEPWMAVDYGIAYYFGNLSIDCHAYADPGTYSSARLIITVNANIFVGGTPQDAINNSLLYLNGAVSAIKI